MNKIKVALIGAGVWGQTHASLYNEHPYVELAGVCDIVKDRAAYIANKFGIKSENIFTCHKDMIKNCDFDVAAIVTPDFLHREFVVDCAEANKNIICEKPVATTREDVLAIMESVNKNNVRLMVDLHNRFSPAFAAAKESVDNGEIGDVYHAYFRLNDTKYVPTQMLSWSEKSSVLWFLGSHSVDTLRWIFNSEVKRVYSVSRKGVLEKLGVNIEDFYMTTLEFENGCVAQMENGWITPETHPSINDIKFNLMGTKGMISLDLTNSQMIERFTEKKSDHPDILVNHFVHGKAMGFSYQSIRYFIDRMIDGKESFITAEDSYNVSFVVLGILESAKRREPVDISYS